MRIDKKALLQEANAIEVAQYIGMTVEKKGANYFTLCPGHKKRMGREDINIGNCVLYPNGYRCMACDPDTTHDVFDMVQEFTGCSFPEALQTVAEIYGGENLFASTDNTITEKLPLSSDDLKLIGLKPHGQKFSPINGSYEHFEPDAGNSIKKINNEYLLCKSPSSESLINLRKNNPKEFNRLIARKAKEAGEKYCRTIKRCKNRTSPDAGKVFDLFEKDGSIDDSTFISIVNALKRKAWRCKEIFDVYKED